MRNKSAALVHLDDRKLVKAVLNGDETAFREFFDDFYPRLYRFALMRLGDDHEVAEDMAQQTLSRALRSLRSYRGEAQLFTWLCSICRNQIIDWQRKHAGDRAHVVHVEDAAWIRAAVDSLHAPAGTDPQALAMRSDLVRAIHVALDRLPASYGRILELKYIQEFSLKEIAEQSGAGFEATRSLLARARRAFADVYQTLSEGVHSNADGA